MKLFAPLFQRRTYLETIDLLLDLVFGVLWFTVFTTVTSVGFSLVISLVGIPILALALLWARAAARVERWRVRLFLGNRIEQPQPRKPRSNDLRQKTVALSRSPNVRSRST